jgi:hypothetical protein
MRTQVVSGDRPGFLKIPEHGFRDRNVRSQWVSLILFRQGL